MDDKTPPRISHGVVFESGGATPCVDEIVEDEQPASIQSVVAEKSCVACPQNVRIKGDDYPASPMGGVVVHEDRFATPGNI